MPSGLGLTVRYSAAGLACTVLCVNGGSSSCCRVRRTSQKLTNRACRQGTRHGVEMGLKGGENGVKMGLKWG